MTQEDSQSEKSKKDDQEPTPVPPSPAEEPSVDLTEMAASQDVSATGFSIVGIGASAGGLEAFKQFFTHLPADSGMAFILVQHLDPTHKSILSSLIAQYTAMPVSEVEDGIQVRPNHVYTIPPNRDLAILHGKLQLLEPTAARGRRTPIDFFFRSLAQDQEEQAIGIVLSGSGTEGTLGLKAIKEVGGLVVVQDPTSAEYDSMPRSAAATGLADLILPSEQIPERLLAYAKHPRKELTVPEPLNHLQKICVLLRSHTGHDFSQYKPNTLLRRISRRMAVHQLDAIADYVRYLRENPLEVEVLFKELLIVVTRFFREPEAFASLAEKVIPSFLKDRSPDQSVRVWVPGCATGEEAYSIAILLREQMDQSYQDFPVEIFATDLDAEAIEVARQGIYPEAIAADISSERLQHFFVQEDHSYRIKKSIRDWLVFAEQSLIKDPPFSKLDLISCRNLLIYLEGELQKKLLPLFHYALRSGGYLFLGNSESIGEATELFVPIDRKWKLFQRRETQTAPGQVGFFLPVVPSAGKREKNEEKATPLAAYRELAEKSLLEHYDTAALLVDEQGEVLYIHGRTGRYLEPAPGEVRWTLLNMAREGLRLVLATCLRQAQARQEEVRRQRVPVKANGGRIFVDLTVRPVREAAVQEGMMMVVLEPVPESEPKTKETLVSASAEEALRIGELERELQATREYLQTTIEELETANEELKSSNEELQSTNEELQSTNEELETSKEEQQSVNEELATVNAELQNKVELLSRTQNDMQNLLASTEVGTVFLDLALNVQRFTPAVIRIIHLIDTDVGRPIGDIVINLNYPELVGDARQVLETLVPRECEVQSRDSSWYAVRIGPYRTIENVIDGLVITFIDITDQKQVQEELRKSNARWRSITENSPDHIMLLDREGRILFINRTVADLTVAEVIGTPIYDYVPGTFRETIQACLVRVWKTGKPGQYETEYHARNGKIRIFESQVSPVKEGEEITTLVVGSRDVTERRRMQAAAAEEEEETKFYAQAIVDTVREPLVILDGDLRVQSASQSFYSFFQVAPEVTQGRLIYELGSEQWNIPALRELLGGILPKNSTFDGFEVEHEFPHLGKRKILLNARRIRRKGDGPQLILLAMEDITEKR